MPFKTPAPRLPGGRGAKEHDRIVAGVAIPRAATEFTEDGFGGDHATRFLDPLLAQASMEQGPEQFLLCRCHIAKGEAGASPWDIVPITSLPGLKRIHRLTALGGSETRQHLQRRLCHSVLRLSPRQDRAQPGDAHAAKPTQDLATGPRLIHHRTLLLGVCCSHGHTLP